MSLLPAMTVITKTKAPEARDQYENMWKWFFSEISSLTSKKISLLIHYAM